MRNFRNRSHFSWMPIAIISLSCMIGFAEVSIPAEYPARPIQVVVSYPPGGGSDITARLLADKLAARLGQPIIVVNKGGGGGALGVTAALAEPPDGYTIYVGTSAQLMLPILRKGVSFDLLRDFKTVTVIGFTPWVLTVKKESRWRSYEDFIAEAKKNPGKLSYSSSGYGGTHHFASELLQMYANVKFNHVPMDGNAPANAAVLGGHVDFCPNSLAVVSKFIKAGSIRGLLVMDRKHISDFPDIPTTSDKGLPFIIGNTQQFMVRTGTPQAIVTKLAGVFKAVLNDEKVVKSFRDIGVEILNIEGEEAAKYLDDEFKMRSEVAKKANILPQ